MEATEIVVRMTLVVRHALSQANNRENIGTPAFASADAPLMDVGIVMAKKLGETLRCVYAVNTSSVNAATSTMLRTRQTAMSAGFSEERLRSYAVLDEAPQARELAELRAMLDVGMVPPEAIEAAYRVLERPPKEDVWFTHGLVIAGLCKVLGVYRNGRVVPKFCEVRELVV